MSTRPKRQSSSDAIAKIRDILAWESCPESSEAFQTAAARMELEFRSAKRRRTALAHEAVRTALSTPVKCDDGEDDHCDDDEESDADGSEPSSSDMYSDPGSSSDDDSAPSESCSSACDETAEAPEDSAATLE